MEITLNGDPREIEPGTNVADLVADCQLDARRVAVEVNEQLVRRATYEHTSLQPGDRVEIVTLVGGG